MSAHFEAGKDCPAIKRATRAFTETLLAEMLPGMQLAARGCGYALAVHGSLARDIDLIAVPWTEHCDTPEYLLQQLKGAVAAQVGRSLTQRDEKWTEKPHGRRSCTIILAGICPEIDLSVMPRIEKEVE